MYKKCLFLIFISSLFHTVAASLSTKECIYKADFIFKDLPKDAVPSTITPNWATNTATITASCKKKIIVHQSILGRIKRDALITDALVIRVFLTPSGNEQYSFDITRERLDEICEFRKTLTGAEFIQNCVIEKVIKYEGDISKNAMPKARINHDWFGESLALETTPFIIKQQNGQEYRAHDLLDAYKDSITKALEQKTSILLTLRQVHHNDLPTFNLLCVPELIAQEFDDETESLAQLIEFNEIRVFNKNPQSTASDVPTPKKSLFESLFVWKKPIIAVIFCAAGFLVIYGLYSKNKV